MSENQLREIYFEAPLLDREVTKRTINLANNPYLYNDAGTPTFVNTCPLNSLVLDGPANSGGERRGLEHHVLGVLETELDPQFGEQTQLHIEPKANHFVEYQPLLATKNNAAAFGMVLVEPGEAIEIQSDVTELTLFQYEYGAFAGHWNPYRGLKQPNTTGRQLLTYSCTDLEHHNFPHVFASVDPHLPLVVTVARYFPTERKIYLADLWVRQGHALYIPAKNVEFGQQYIDLHNNRNSALACWGSLNNHSIQTQTLLQDEHGYFYWYWDKQATLHRHLDPKLWAAY